MMAILEPRRAIAELPVLMQRGVNDPIISYPSLDRAVTTVTPEAPTAPLIREPGTATAVPRMISEAIPIPGISSGANIPKSMIKIGSADKYSINPLVGAGLGALIGNIISARNQPTRLPLPGGGTQQPGTGTSGGSQQGGNRPGGTSGGTSGGTTSGGGTGGGYTGPVGIFTRNPDGTITQVMDDGSKITTDSSGNVIFVEEAPEDNWVYDENTGTYYDSKTGVIFDPATGTEQFPPFEGGDSGGGDSGGGDIGDVFFDQPNYGYDYQTPNYDSQYDFSDLYDYYGGGYGYADYAPYFDFSYGDDFGTGDLYGNYDYQTFFKKGGMATPLMKRGGIVKMSNGGDPMFTLDEISDEADFWSNYSNQKDSDVPMMNLSATMDSSEITGTADDQYPYVAELLNRALPGQPGYGWRYFDDGTTIDPQGNYYFNGEKVYDINVGFGGMGARLKDIASNFGSTASGALNSIQNFASNYPGTTGALAGALLSQALSQQSGGGKENLGVDMAEFGKISPRTTTFGVGAPRFMTYEQYGTPERMPEMYGEELYRNLNVPGFNPVNRQMAGGGLASMAQGGSTYYTFGRSVDPAENLMGMKNGGAPMAMTDDVPVIAGRRDYREGAAVNGPGDGQSDDIPAMLADGEYVIDAETVAMLGNGSNKAGAKKLDEFRENIRAHKRATPLDKIPKPAKSPLAYLKGSK